MAHAIRLNKTKPQGYTEWFEHHGVKMIRHPVMEDIEKGVSLLSDQVWWRPEFKRSKDGAKLSGMTFFFHRDQKDLSVLFKLTFG